jgi:hypothetical protein
MRTNTLVFVAFVVVTRVVAGVQQQQRVSQPQQ